MIWTVIPSKTDEYLDRCLSSLESCQPGSLSCVMVVDSGLHQETVLRWRRQGVLAISAGDPFVFARAINRGVRACSETSDLLLLNDDTAMQTRDWRSQLELLLGRRVTEGYGILSLEIYGGVGNLLQHVDPRRPAGYVTPSDTTTIAFVAALIRREVWTQVGELDERFTGYGWEDDDYCRRTRLAGWRCGVLAGIHVMHGWKEFPHSASYRKDYGSTLVEASEKNRELFEAKWKGIS